MIPGWNMDPFEERYWTTDDRSDAPKEHYRYVAGARHPSEAELGHLIRRGPPRSGKALSIAYVSPIVRQADGSRGVEHLRWLTLDWRLRNAHIGVFGPPGTGKTTQVMQPAILSDLVDPDRLTILMGLKRENYGWVSVKCAELGVPLHYVDLRDPKRSLGFNPLATDSAEDAYDVIAVFAEVSNDPQAHDSVFWNQAGRTLLCALWDCGARSFPAMLQKLESGSGVVLALLKRGGTGACTAAAAFLVGGSHNSDTVMATVSGWLNPFRSQAVAATTHSHELGSLRLFEGRKVLYVHADEGRLTSMRSVYNLLFQWLLRRIIEHSDDLPPGTAPHPTSLHVEDLPAWGAVSCLPAQLTTLRARGASLTASIQSMAALVHAYGSSAGVVASAFGTKFVLPGVDMADAQMFSAMTGDRVVEVGGDAGQRGTIMTVPLLSAAEIRTPEARHFISGRPITILTSELAFQAFMPPVFRRPDLVGLFAKAARTDSRAPLRATPLHPPPRGERPGPDGGPYVFPGHLTTVQLRERIKLERARIGWDDAKREVRQWWEAREAEHQDSLQIIHQAIHELACRKVTVSALHANLKVADTNNLGALIHYWDYNVLKLVDDRRRAEARRPERRRTKREE